MTDDTRAAWLDWEYDRENADTGTRSRYGNYLRMNAKSFAEIWTDDPSVEFARIAWRNATGPILVPPLVRLHPRITHVSLQRSEWDGEMIADVGLVSPRPSALANAKTADGDYYLDQYRDSWDRYQSIGAEDLTRSAYLLTEARLLWQLPAGTLPTIKEVPTSHDAIYDQAVECLEVLVDALNRQVSPVLEQVERA